MHTRLAVCKRWSARRWSRAPAAHRRRTGKEHHRVPGAVLCLPASAKQGCQRAGWLWSGPWFTATQQPCSRSRLATSAVRRDSALPAHVTHTHVCTLPGERCSLKARRLLPAQLAGAFQAAARSRLSRAWRESTAACLYLILIPCTSTLYRLEGRPFHVQGRAGASRWPCSDSVRA